MVVAVVASYVYSVIVGLLVGFRVHALDGYWVRITLWFVLPTGAVLGVYLPQSMAGLNHKMAMKKGFRWGAVSGVVCGALWATQLSLSVHAVEMLPWWIFLFGGTMGIYSACVVAWIGGKYANRELPHRTRLRSDEPLR